MQRVINIHIEKLPEGICLATSDDIQGLVAQGKTIPETLEIARDVVQKLLKARAHLGASVNSGDSFDYPLIIAT